jgi:hypothetical protein
MTRRASRPGTPRAQSAGRPRAPNADPLRTLSRLLATRGTPDAERSLEAWIDASMASPDVFSASADYLAASTSGFSTAESWYLLAALAEMVDDPVLSPACDALEDRLEVEERSWPGNEGLTMDAHALSEASPVYRAMSDAWSSLRVAIEVGFLRDIGVPPAARAMTAPDGMWERTMRDAEATLLGVPRLVIDADDDPFGILRA